MREKIFLLFVLLCTIVQGTWAQNFDVWDGVTKTKPEEYLGRIVIRTAAELAYIRDNYDEEEWGAYTVYTNVGNYEEYKEPYKMPISLEADIDMGDKVSWIPLGWTGSSKDYYESTFYGNGHTIRINIDGATKNYQGLFCGIHSDGKVENLHVTGNIHCTESRLVGGIAGENDGTIENCWVTANVSSDWQDSGVAVTGSVGGIAGENNGTIQFCCMAGDVTNNDADVGGLVGNNDGILSHCTFYGTRHSSHSQDSKYVGDTGTTEEYLYDTFQISELEVGGDCYHYAIKYPWRVTVNTEGNGTIQTYAAGENDVPGTRAGETFTLRVPSGNVISCTVTDADGTTLLWDTQATGKTSFWFTMPNKNVTATIVFDYTDWPRQGAGTEDDPYIISSAADWNDFAHNVNLGRSYSGKYVKLTSDISVTKSAGGYQTDENCQPFSGTFDGDGHTLTINLNNQSRFAAPFKCVSGATIKNLRTAGTIDGTGNADGKLLAGIIGVSFGNTTITGCRSSMSLTTDLGEDAALAGLVAGTKGGSLTIAGCAFDGSMTGGSNTRCAGIAGYEYAATTTTISYTLFAPKTLTVSTADDGYTKTISRDADATITNCYYMQTLGTAQGTQAVASTTLLSELGSLVQDYGWVKVFENGLLSGGKSYVTPGTNSTCTGTAEDPYIISNNDQWTILAAYVNGGNNFSGKVFSLVADINISTPVGLYDPNFNTYIFNSFNGTFLGNGHTITAALNNDDYQGLAPFRYIYGATIKDLKVAGNIASNHNYASGLVGFASGTNLIENCIVTATLNISSDYAGGIIGHGRTSTTTIRGCAFTGTVNGVDGNRSNIGGLWGWSNSGTPKLEGCLEAGTYTNIASMHPMGLQGTTGTITNCYYVNPQVGEPRNACTVSGAKQAYVFTTAPANLGELVKDYGTIKVYQNGILYNGTYYVAPASISLANAADNSTTISNADGYVANVTLSGRTLYKDGAWNTICLPFDVTIAGSPLAGATARPLTEASISGSTLTLTFGDAVTTLEAGTPYIIKWTADANYVDDDEHNIVSPVFSGVTIDADADGSYDTKTASPAVTTDERVRFLGTYKSTAFDAEDKSILLMGGANTLYYPTAGAGIGAQRAYFKIGSDGALLARRLTAFNIDFGEGTQTGIISIENGKLKIENDADAWFTLDGRKLSGKPSVKGVYVNNGRKVIIK